MQRYWVLDDRGEPLAIDDLMAWADWFEHSGRERVLAQDRDEAPGAPDVTVSTVFLGLNHQWWEDGPPILWETMILGGIHNGYQARYTSREEALVGHQEACQLVRQTRRGEDSDAVPAE